jgi:MinD-like ATPase involved in chromosome partitioning or flagellar assembly
MRSPYRLSAASGAHSEPSIAFSAVSGENVCSLPREITKRVIMSMGGKGGVGKTAQMVGLVEWYDHNEIPVQLLDLDTENKARGSLAHFYPSRAAKVNIHTAAGLDAFVDCLGDGAPIVVADMGAGAGGVTTDWFDAMYQSSAEAGIAFTAIGVVTEDPASVASALGWANQLQQRVAYIVVKNSTSPHADFHYWENSLEAKKFIEVFSPAVIHMGYRLPELEGATRNHGVTLGSVAGRKNNVPELQKSSLVMRAQSYRRAMSAEFDRVKEVLLP